MAKDSPKAETAPLDLGPLPTLTGYLLRRAQIANFAQFIQLLGELDLRPAQFSALVAIDRNPGCKQSDIAEALGIQRPNFVAMMDELERRGLARREKALVDRRSHVLILTPKGKETLERAEALVLALEDHISARLGPEDHQKLRDLLDKLCALRP